MLKFITMKYLTLVRILDIIIIVVIRDIYGFEETETDVLVLIIVLFY